MSTALVTGATAGIGNAFARLLAGQGHDLVLVARDAERLGQVAAGLRDRHGVEVETLAADLTDREQLERVADRLRDASRPVDVLVSNAGFSLNHNLLRSGTADEERLLDVLVRAVLVLAKAAVPGMVDRGRGRIVTVSSVAGFIPSGTYSAAKAWATTFTISLAGELAGTGVTATALCPGYVHTEFHQRAGLEMSMLPSWAWLEADRLVADCWADVRRGAAVSVPSLRYKLAVVGLRHLPLRLIQMMGRRRGVRRSPAAAPPSADTPAARFLPTGPFRARDGGAARPGAAPGEAVTGP
ncbi:MAG TPA: SDR family oxidoreductase [Kineosporiaceae bacterium]|nr:SDR family oxidoreductase [Kineosporiaceae bacterium]